MTFDEIGGGHTTFTIDGKLGVAFNTNQGFLGKVSQDSIESQLNIEVEENKEEFKVRGTPELSRDWTPNQINLGSCRGEAPAVPRGERMPVDEESAPSRAGHNKYVLQRPRSNSAMLDRKLPRLIDQHVNETRKTIHQRSQLNISEFERKEEEVEEIKFVQKKPLVVATDEEDIALALERFSRKQRQRKTKSPKPYEEIEQNKEL